MSFTYVTASSTTVSVCSVSMTNAFRCTRQFKLRSGGAPNFGLRCVCLKR